jgi:hypothetical protein
LFLLYLLAFWTLKLSNTKECGSVVCGQLSSTRWGIIRKYPDQNFNQPVCAISLKPGRTKNDREGKERELTQPALEHDDAFPNYRFETLAWKVMCVHDSSNWAAERKRNKFTK